MGPLQLPRVVSLTALLAAVSGLGCAPPPQPIPTLPPPPVHPVASAARDDEPPPAPARKAAPVETAKSEEHDDDEPEGREGLVATLGALQGSGIDLTSLSAGGSGLGAGGGGATGGGIGLGSVGTIGHGAGTGTGFGRLGSGAGPTVTLRQGATQVVGRLPPEVIQRVVRMNFGRMRLCYETALRANPKLAGRASVRFVIGPTGAVASAAPGPTDFAPAALQACLASAFQKMSFPRPEGGGSVTVIYPVHFATDPPDPSPPPPGARSAPPPPPPPARRTPPPPPKSPPPKSP